LQNLAKILILPILPRYGLSLIQRFSNFLVLNLTEKEDKMSNAVIYATDASFDADILKSDVAVLVDYWASWCGPCKMIAPILDEIAADYAGRLKVVKINIDEEKQSAARFGIRNIPTLLVFKNGQVVDKQVGAVPKNVLAAKLDAQM